MERVKKGIVVSEMLKAVEIFLLLAFFFILFLLVTGDWNSLSKMTTLSGILSVVVDKLWQIVNAII